MPDVTEVLFQSVMCKYIHKVISVPQTDVNLEHAGQNCSK